MRGGQRLVNLGVFLKFVVSCVPTLAVSVREDAVPGSRVEQLGDLTEHYYFVHQAPSAPRFIVGGADTADLLVPAEGLDAETCHIFDLTITQTDQHNRNHMNVSLQVRVLDVNEFAPTFRQPSYSANVTSDSVEVLQVEAVDRDLEAKVEFSITDGNILDTFGITTVYRHAAQSAATGLIYVQTNKRFTRPIYTLTVAASDGSKSALATVLIYYECSSNPCQNGATCYNLQNSYSCQCVPGWTGTNCQTDIDECATSPCQNGATCYNLQNSYSCQCVPGWTGTNCQTDIDECSSNPCQNGATCYNLQNSYSCQCVPGWTGTNCQTDIDECATNPCQNGTTCYNLQNSYSCQGVPGGTGPNCQIVVASGGMCPAQADQHGAYWTSAPAPSRPYLEHACPPQYTGEVYRRCGENAVWHETVYNCTADTLTQLKQEMLSSSPNVTYVLKQLVNFTSVQNDSIGTLLVGDVQETTDILEGIVDIVDAEGQVADEQFEDFLRVADNLMDANTTDSWRSIIAETRSGVDKVLTNIDRYVEKVAKAERESVNKTTFVQTNFYVELGETGGGAGAISFPDRSSANLPHWASTAVNTISLPLHTGMANVSYSSIIYKDLRDMIPEWSNNRFALWDTAGCVLASYDADSGVVVCTCSHLTNFAVLMSHAPASVAHHTALGIISMAGCVTSMLCLVLTFALYVYHWKSVKSELAQLLLHLCTVLFLAYLTFLLGVDKTAHKTLCTAVAVILHFLYLTVFFIMLAKSLYLAKMCLLPLNKTPITKWCFLAAYGGPVLVVGVSLGVTQLHGYGTDTTCWLSIHSGLLWAFVGPVLFVIVVNVGVVILALKVKFSTHAMKKKTHTRKIAEGVRTILLLLPAMGVTWVLGVFSVNEETLVFQYLFAICNSLQGLLIFIVHCLWDKKMRKQVDKTFRRSVRKVRLQGPSSSNAKSTSGTDSTLDTKMTSPPSIDCRDKSFATAI